MNPKIAIVGRPNVGKSTFFNRLTSSHAAITAREAGTTRDRKSGICSWQGKDAEVIDTAGYQKSDAVDTIMKMAHDQIDVAMKTADIILFVVDAREGLTEEDKVFANNLRKLDKEIVLIVNKVDSQREITASYEFEGLGFKMFLISAIRGRGVDEFLDYIFSRLEDKVAKVAVPVVKVAIVGRPNVGKSTLINKLLGEDRIIVSSEPGTTRDTIDVTFSYKGKEVILTDTAGIRKRGKIRVGVEHFGVERSFKTIDESQKVIILVDAIEGPTRQDAHIAQYALDKNKNILVAYNKCDQTKNGEIPHYYRFPFFNRLPYTFISALTGENLEELLDFIVL